MSLLSQEENPLEGLSFFEKKARSQGFKIIAGIDEAGRGPLAGPVVAAACIIPEGVSIPGVDDSKKLTPRERYEVFQKVVKLTEILWDVGVIEALLIDQVNILRATFEAMILAVTRLRQTPDLLLVDGPHAPPTQIPCWPIIRGDAQVQSIALASIMAKETRDRLMDEYHEKWPMYGFHENKGYGTQKHRKALEEYGPCPIHRTSFEPVKSLMKRSPCTA